jgi:hypothetical protein
MTAHFFLDICANCDVIAFLNWQGALDSSGLPCNLGILTS